MKKYLAEFIGTCSLVLFGCGAAVIAGNAAVGPSGIGLLGISIAFGFAVVAMAYAIGGISGCHINPAVTIGVLTAGKMEVKDAIGYIISQCLGAILGAAILYLIAVDSVFFCAVKQVVRYLFGRLARYCNLRVLG